jgi:hypothetical protein
MTTYKQQNTLRAKTIINICHRQRTAVMTTYKHTKYSQNQNNNQHMSQTTHSNYDNLQTFHQGTTRKRDRTFSWLWTLKLSYKVLTTVYILRTNCLLDFVHSPDEILKYNIKSRRFGSWLFFRLQVMGGETLRWVLLDWANLNHWTYYILF